METDSLVVCDKALEGRCPYAEPNTCKLYWTTKYKCLVRDNGERVVKNWMRGSAVCGGILIEYREVK